MWEVWDSVKEIATNVIGWISRTSPPELNEIPPWKEYFYFNIYAYLNDKMKHGELKLIKVSTRLLDAFEVEKINTFYFTCSVSQ